MERVTFSPGEFAALFGKSQTCGYRQIYAGRVVAITEYVRLLIPASEVEKILASAGRYEGLKKPAQTKKDFEKLRPEIRDAWSAFVRRNSQPAKDSEASGEPRATEGGKARRAMLRRLSKR